MWPEVYPADAHDAPLLPRQMRAVIGAVGFCNIGSLVGPCGRKYTQLMLMMIPSCCGRKYTQLMLMMLPSCLVKCAQSLVGQLVFATSGVQGAMWPEVYAADAHDAPLLPRSNVRSHWGSWFLQHLESRGPCGRKYTQLMLMMLPSCLVKCAQSLGQLVFTTSGVQGPCGRKYTQLMLMSPPASSNARSHWGSWFLQHLESRGPCGRKYTQLMLMMLPS